MLFLRNMKYGVSQERLCNILKVRPKIKVWVLYDLRNNKEYIGNYRTQAEAIKAMESIDVI